jgi:DNA repair/transcription protein MET18/MMS19
LALLRHPVAYSAIDRPISVLKLSSVDPAFVDEAARNFGIVAQGKGKGKEQASHLTAKVR